MSSTPISVSYKKALLERYERERRRRFTSDGWSKEYTNRDTGRVYAPHHVDERAFVEDDRPRYMLARGGEGGGKSVAGIVKTLERLRRGMSGIMVSPDLPHFKRSLWPEFQRWCPWSQVVESQQRRGKAEWQPSDPFMLNFKNGTSLLCGGIENPGSWEGPNVHFAHFDEARHKKEPDALKVLAGRIRLLGPLGEPPQLFLTTTPRKHWLFDYFGPLIENDPNAVFKASAIDVILRTADNIVHLDPDYVVERGAVLSETERRVLLDAEWEDIEDVDRFLPSMIWWDDCREHLAPLDRSTPLTFAADAGVVNDSFGLVGVSRHPARPNDVAVRYVRQWIPRGVPLDFDAIEDEIKDICKRFNVKHLAYDAYQLHQMMTRLKNKRVVDTDPFSQQAERLVADKQLLDLITQKRIAHDGNEDLKAHISNADRKMDANGTRLRLVKRTDGLKIDLAVALSMAAARCLGIQQPSRKLRSYSGGINA